MKKNKVKLGLSLLIVLSTPIAVNAVASSEAHAEKSTISTGGYVNEVYYVDGKPANWWYDDGKDWFFFQNGKKFTGNGKDNAGAHHFVNGKYANGKIGNKEYRDGKEISVENKVPIRGYVNGVYYVDAKPANWWYDDGTNWYFFQNGKKLTGYGKDNAGIHYFVNGEYANWWYNDGTNWYFYQNGKKLTGYGKDNAGDHYFVNGKYANWWYNDGQDWYFFQNGQKLTGYGKDNAGTHYFVNGKYANWWYNDGQDWYFFQNGQKLTGYGKDNAGDHYFVNGKYANAKEENKNTKRAIFLDPGHGGSDSGAVSNGLREKDLTLSVYNKVSSRLASLGYSVLTSRNTDKDVGLVDRADQANKSNADMFLSIHFNAGGRGASYGIETYYYKARPEYIPAINKAKHNDPERLEKSRKLAQKIQQSLVRKTGAYDRGVKRETFAVLRETSIPSILVELGFIDNQEEANKIKTNEYQEKLADGIVDGIVEYYK